MRRSLPCPCCLPGLSRRSASATPLSRLAQGLLALRPAGLLDRPRRPLSRGFVPPSHPGNTLASYQFDRQFTGWILLPLVFRAFVAHGEPVGDGGRREGCERGSEVGPAHPGDVEGGALESLQEGVIERVEEIEAFDRLVADAMRPGEAIEGFEAAGEIIEGGREGSGGRTRGGCRGGR